MSTEHHSKCSRPHQNRVANIICYPILEPKIWGIKAEKVWSKMKIFLGNVYPVLYIFYSLHNLNTQNGSR